MKKKETKVNVSWINYSCNDTEEIKVSSDLSFFDHLILYKSVRNRILAIIAIALFLIII